MPRRAVPDISAAVVLFLAALGAFAQSEADNRQQVELHARRAQQYLDNKRPDLALGEFNAIVALDPNNLDACANAGVLLYFQGRFGEAARQLRSVLQRKPELWKLQALLGMSEKRSGEAGKARTDLEQSFPHVTDEKLRIEAGLELIEVYYGAGELAKAAEIVNALRQLRPADVDILYTAHRIYSELSEETMLSLAMAAPDSARMHQLMAHELARQAKHDAAIAHYREALKQAPQRSDLHFELAELLNTSSRPSDREEAEREYRTAFAENPFDEKAECRLADMAARGSDLKEALERYSRAVEMQPEDADANLGLAKTLMAMHEPRKAEPPLERAAQLEPFNPATHYRLGVLYRELGRGEDAARELAEFSKLKKMKTRLSDLYQEMQLQPARAEQPDPDVPK